MATAPKPGAAKAAKPKIMKIRVKEQELTLLPENLSMGEKLAVRQGTGLPYDAFYREEMAFGEDSLCVLWWLARRANGEPRLDWRAAAREWPAPLTLDDVELSIVEDDGEDNHPES